MMSSSSKSNQGRDDQLNFIPEPKQRGRVMHTTPNWLELPSDIMANILYRVGVFDIIENAQKVCTAWRRICKDPAMWRVIYMGGFSNPHARLSFDEIFKQAVNRSQGQLVDITIVDYGNDDLLLHIADSSPQLRRLNIACCYGEICETWTIALKKFPLLEELSLYSTEITKEAIETAGRYCPLLKTLKVNREAPILWDSDSDGGSISIPDVYSYEESDEIAIAIGKNLTELRELELIGSNMSNIGLQIILDGCCHLESLDLRKCLLIDLKGTMGNRCLEQIKYLKRPNDSLEGCPYIYENESVTYELYSESDEESDGFLYSDEDSDDFFCSDSEDFVDFDNSTDHDDEDDVEDYDGDDDDDDFTNL